MISKTSPPVYQWKVFLNGVGWPWMRHLQKRVRKVLGFNLCASLLAFRPSDLEARLTYCMTDVDTSR